MSERTSREHDRTESDQAPTDERPATSNEEDVKTGMHRPGTDPAKQIPAKEGGET